MTDMNMLKAKIHAIACDNSEAVKLNPVISIFKCLAILGNDRTAKLNNKVVKEL